MESQKAMVVISPLKVNLEKAAYLRFFSEKSGKNSKKREHQNPLSHYPEGNERILIVDDEKTVTDVMEQMLIELGYRVTSYNNSLAALEFFRLQPFFL
jgi:PleD family two-component response regulator